MTNYNITKLFIIVTCVLCCQSNASRSEQVYKAGLVNVSGGDVPLDHYAALISEASKMNVDLLVLPSLDGSETDPSSLQAACGLHSYDEAVRDISNVTKQGRLYVIAHLLEKIKCRNSHEIIRTNLVFDRKGAVIAMSRKPINVGSSCNSTTREDITFTADFGATFRVLMEEDLALLDPRRLKGVRNVVVSGKWNSDMSFLNATQLSAPWAYINEVNLISSAGIYAGQYGAIGSGSKIVTAELNIQVSMQGVKLPITEPTYPSSEDLSQYAIRPLHLADEKHKEILCHDKLCCEFHVKPSVEDNKILAPMNHYIVVYSGLRHFTGMRIIGVQICAVVTCQEFKGHTCFNRFGNKTNVIFKEISISGNFTKDNALQYPLIVSQDNNGKIKGYNRFKLEKNILKANVTQYVTFKGLDIDVTTFGIFSRVYSEDTITSLIRNTEDSVGLTRDIFEYLYSEDVQEWFDYLWIRLRILVFVVSIYVLEMM